MPFAAHLAVDIHFFLPLPPQPTLDRHIDQFSVFSIKGVTVGVFCVARSNFATTTSLGPNITVRKREMMGGRRREGEREGRGRGKRGEGGEKEVLKRSLSPR